MVFKMEQGWGKVLVSSVAIFGLSTSIFAGPEIKSSKDKQLNFAFAYPKDMHLANPIDLYFYVEGLAMQGMESNLQFALVDSATSSTQPNAEVGGFGQDSSWGYNFGVRGGFGVYVDHDAWNIDFDWMWLNITNSKQYQAGGGATLPVWLPDSGVAFVTQETAGANWGCQVNVFDATLGKPHYISRRVIFNPHFGLRVASIDQDYHVNYGGETVAQAVKFKASNDFCGIGARAGIDTDWLLGYGFKMFSNLSSSILAGWFETKEHFAVSTTAVRGKLVNKPQMIVPNLELSAGFDWGTDLGNCKYYLALRAGYEFQIWWNQWNMRQLVTGGLDGNFINVPVQGDLTLNGFTFKIQFDM